MRLSHTSLAGNPAGVVAASVPALVADSASSGICASVAAVAAVGRGHAHGGAEGCPADAADDPTVAVVPAIMAVT
eukprot:7501007-Pyramimonas_sp.AAC.1